MKRPVAVRIWGVAGLVLGVIAVAMAGPMTTAWRCYQAYHHGERAEATIVGKESAPYLRVEIASGPRAGETCTTETNHAHHEAVELGTATRVIFVDGRVDCTLEATLENSQALLYAVTAALAALVLLIVLVALRVQRSFGEVLPPTSRFDPPLTGVVCPSCEAPMAEGFLVPMAGVHWRSAGEPVGLPNALGGLPGTTSWRGRPRLHAFHCDKCQVATFRYA